MTSAGQNTVQRYIDYAAETLFVVYCCSTFFCSYCLNGHCVCMQVVATDGGLTERYATCAP
jgi:hypothetical protein